MLNIKIHNEDGNVYCEICNEKIENDEYYIIESNNYNIILNCGHVVHYNCLHTFKNDRCPCCDKKMIFNLKNDKYYCKRVNNNSLLKRIMNTFY